MGTRGGQPTKYKADYCDKLIEFFDIEPWEERKIPHYKKEGKSKKYIAWTEIKLLPVKMPSLTKFAKFLNICRTTVYNWADSKHASFQEEFLNALTHARQIRKEWLIDGGLAGIFPPSSFKYVASNVTDMSDKQEYEVGGKDGGPIPVSIVDFRNIDDNSK